MRVLLMGKDGIRRVYGTGRLLGLKVQNGWVRIKSGRYHIDPTAYFRDIVPVHGTLGLWKIPKLTIEFDEGNPEPLNRLDRPAPISSRTAEAIQLLAQGAPLNSWLPHGTDWRAIMFVVVIAIVALGVVGAIMRLV